jgi:nucleoside-diphosphate-sugar epimerase
VTLAIVFGANGFIGRHVAGAMLAQPDLDVVGAGLGLPVAGMESRWLGLDLLADDEHLETELRDAAPNLIVNCTGAIGGTAADLIRLNVQATARLLTAMDGSGIRARFIQIGSAAEYGPGPMGVPVSETACPQPASPYGIAKLAATQLVAAAAAAGREAVVLRVFNALGPGGPHGTLSGTAVRSLTEAVATSAPRVEMGPLGTIRDFVDIRDIADAVVAACRAPALEAPIVNIGSGVGHSARELVVALADRLGYAGEIGEDAAESPRSSSVPWQVADVSLAARVLGWRATHDLASSVELMTSDPAAKPS